MADEGQPSVVAVAATTVFSVEVVAHADKRAVSPEIIVHSIDVNGARSPIDCHSLVETLYVCAPGPLQQVGLSVPESLPNFYGILVNLAHGYDGRVSFVHVFVPGPDCCLLPRQVLLKVVLCKAVLVCFESPAHLLLKL